MRVSLLLGGPFSGLGGVRGRGGGLPLGLREARVLHVFLIGGLLHVLRTRVGQAKGGADPANTALLISSLTHS